MLSASDKIRFIESLFGRCTVHAKNVDVKCPICDDSKKRRLSIRLSDDVNHCWVCGWGARSLLPLVIKFGTREQVHEYKTKFVPELPNAKKLVEQQENVTEELIQRVRLPSDFRLLTLSRDAKDPDIRMLNRYCEKRGLGLRELWRWRLGSSNVGLLRRRVIVPSFDCEGDVNYYVARSIDQVPYNKYLNCEAVLGTPHSIKNDIVFNELNIDWSQKLVIVEGPFDLMKCRMNATCLLGSSFSPRSLLFQRVLENQTPVVLMLDDEMHEKSQKIGKLLTTFNVPVSIARITSHHDPGDMTFDQVAEHVEAARPWSWESYLSYKLSTTSNRLMRI